MFKNTLKERYELKQERLFESVILREFNRDQMKQAVQLFKALQSTDMAKISQTLAASKDEVIRDVETVLSSKSQQGLIRKFVSLFKKKSENPLLDAFAYCDALKNFFEVFLEYIEARKTNVP